MELYAKSKQTAQNLTRLSRFTEISNDLYNELKDYFENDNYRESFNEKESREWLETTYNDYTRKFTNLFKAYQLKEKADLLIEQLKTDVN